MDASSHRRGNEFDSGSSGILTPGRFFKTRAILWATFLFSLALGFFFASVFGANWLGLKHNWFYLPPIVLPVLAGCVYALLVRRLEKRKVWEFAIRLSMLWEGVAGFLIGGGFIAAMWALLWSAGLYSVRRGVWRHWFDDMVFDSYISAVLEELAFRAVLLRIFARIWDVRTAIVLSSILFGLAHFAHGSWLGILGIIINAGLALGLLYVITGSLWMSIGMHLGFDFVETSVLGVGSHHGFLISTPKADAAAWLTGGTFGPDAAIPAMILGLLINLVLWWIAFRKTKATTSDASHTTGLAGRSSPGALEA